MPDNRFQLNQSQNGTSGSNDEREQTLNQILTEMNDFNGTEDVVVMAATNRSDVLDPALTRPGRFDRVITVSPPDQLGREKILQVHTREIPLAADVGTTSRSTSTSRCPGTSPSSGASPPWPGSRAIQRSTSTPSTREPCTTGWSGA